MAWKNTNQDIDEVLNDLAKELKQSCMGEFVCESELPLPKLLNFQKEALLQLMTNVLDSEGTPVESGYTVLFMPTTGKVRVGFDTTCLDEQPDEWICFFTLEEPTTDKELITYLGAHCSYAASRLAANTLWLLQQFGADQRQFATAMMTLKGNGHPWNVRQHMITGSKFSNQDSIKHLMAHCTLAFINDWDALWNKTEQQAWQTIFTSALLSKLDPSPEKRKENWLMVRNKIKLGNKFILDDPHSSRFSTKKS